MGFAGKRIEASGEREPMSKGAQFQKVGKQVRSVYEQNDGQINLADECKCIVNFSVVSSTNYRPMTVTRVPYCPIDEHKEQTA